MSWTLTHYQRYFGFLIGSHCHLLCALPESLMPELHLIIARRDIGDSKHPLCISDRVVGMVMDNDPSTHPSVHVTGDLNDFGVVKGFFQFLFESLRVHSPKLAPF